MRSPVISCRVIGMLASLAVFCTAAVVARTQGGPVAKEDEEYRNGLMMWREADLGNNSCSFCHSFEATELASYNFDDETIRRRAEPHFGKADAPKLVAFIHAVRKRYGLIHLHDPMKDRPLQPGGQPLPGDTPAARDIAFGLSLEERLPHLTKGEVDSLPAAHQAREELRAIDIRKLPVGIVFNRISEDGFHGKEHATLAHWISDEAVLMKFPWGLYNDMADKYIDNPTTVKLQPLEELLSFRSKTMYGQLMASDKFRMLVILQHIERMRERGIDFFTDKGPVAFNEWKENVLPNPFLELGMLADERQDTPLDQFLFPDAVVAKKKLGPSEEEQMKQLRLPNLWAGWMFDEGLLRSGNCPADRVTRIMAERLFSDGPYPFHAALFINKKLITDGYESQEWIGKTPQHFVIDYSSFLRDDNTRKFEPSDRSARELYRRFVVNCFEMSLYLYKEQLETTHTIYPDPSVEQIAKIREYVQRVAPQQSREVDALASQITKLAGAANK